MFGEDFLIKLGFDVDNEKLKKLRKELDKFKNVKSSAKQNKGLAKEVKQVKSLVSLERKRLAMRKKIDRLNELGHKGKLTDPSRFKKGSSLDKRNVELDEILRVATKEAKKKAGIEKEARSEDNKAKAVQRKKEKTHVAAIVEDFRRTAAHAKRIKAEKLKELILSRRQSRIMRRAVNDFAHAFAAFGIMYAGFASIRDAQQVQFNMENAESQMEIAFGDKAQGMMDNFVGSIQGLELGIGKVASMETLSQVAPALRGRFNEEDTAGIAKELLIVSKFSGQMQDMAAIARNFGQMTTSLEGEDVNQFADRMKGLMPFIYENLRESGKIAEANRASFMKAKDAGNVVSDDFVQAFRKSVQRITKDEKLLAKLGGKLNVAWGALIASIEDSRLAFLGKMDKGTAEDDGRTSLVEQLHSTYETLRAFFSRSTRTWQAWGEVLGDVIEGMTWAFLELEQMYLRFAIMLKNILGLDDDAARRAAIWTALGVVMLPVIGFFVMLGLKLKKLLGIFRILGMGGAAAGGAAASGGFIASVSAFALAVASFVTGTAAIVATFALIESLFISNDGGYGIAKALGVEDYVPDWMMQGVFGDNEFDKLLDEEDDYKKQKRINDTGGVWQELGMSPREKATKYGMGKSGEAAYQKSLIDNKTITFNNTINESNTPQNTAKELTSSMTKGLEGDGFMNTILAGM